MLEEKKITRIAVLTQAVVCGILFCAFSFTYLYVFERDVIEALHYSLAHGLTHYAPLPSALVITFVLLVLRWVTGLLLGLKGKVRALCYFPSFLVLAALTDVGRGIYMEAYHTNWLWLLPLLLALYVLAALALKKLLRVFQMEESSPFALMNSNIIIMFFLSLMTVSIGNHDAMFHYEVDAEHNILAGQYDKALEVGKKSQYASRTLTALRAYAMSRTGSMGELLFEYPQPYGSEGLFFVEDSLLTFRYTNDSIFSFLGTTPANGRLTPDFLRRVCYDGSAKYTALDYYLSSLLLEKETDKFVKAVDDLILYPDSLPRHYREALAMYQVTHPESAPIMTDSLMIERYISYRHDADSVSVHPEQMRTFRREYSGTWWWYHDFSVSSR